MENNYISLEDENGNVVEYRIMSILNIDNVENEIIIFTDKELPKDENMNAYYGYFIKGKIEDIQEESVKEQVEKFIAKFQEDLKNGMKF